MVNLADLKASANNPSYEELSSLSLEAAIDLDRLLRGESTAGSAVTALVKNLGADLNDLGSVQALQSLIDPATVDIYNRAVSYLTQVRANTIDELAAQIRTYADAFKREVTGRPQNELAKMRDFCLALHRELLAEIYERHSETTLDVA